MSELKRKVLVVRPDLGQGGTDRVTLNLLMAFDKRLFSVELLLMRNKGELIREVPSHIKVSCSQSSNLFWFVFPLARKMARLKPDISFAPCGGSAMSLSIAHFLTSSSSRLILSERGRLMRSTRIVNRILRIPIKALFFRRAHAIIAVSQAVSSDLKRYLRVPDKKITVLPNPVLHPDYRELAALPVEHEWFKKKEANVIMHAGRFVEEKDHVSLVRAFASVAEKSDACLMLFGDGPLRVKIENLVRQLGLVERVEFMGFESNLYRYLNRAHIFVLSSKSEGMPGVLIQAMALGIPSVATDCPTGPGELIGSDRKRGLLVPVGDVDALADGILMLILDRSLHNVIKQNAPIATKDYEYATSVRKYMDLING